MSHPLCLCVCLFVCLFALARPVTTKECSERSVKEGRRRAQDQAPPPQPRRISRRGAMLVVTQQSGWRMRSLKHLKPHSRRSLVSSLALARACSVVSEPVSYAGGAGSTGCGHLAPHAFYCRFSLFWKLQRLGIFFFFLLPPPCDFFPHYLLPFFFYASSNSFIPFLSLVYSPVLCRSFRLSVIL